MKMDNEQISELMGNKEEQISDLRRLLNLAVEELKHCGIFVNDYGRPKKVLEMIEKEMLIK